jgi:hypothetical protein
MASPLPEPDRYPLAEAAKALATTKDRLLTLAAEGKIALNVVATALFRFYARCRGYEDFPADLPPGTYPMQVVMAARLREVTDIAVADVPLFLPAMCKDIVLYDDLDARWTIFLSPLALVVPPYPGGEIEYVVKEEFILHCFNP